ncbi:MULTISPECIES: 6-phosphogluconolactonase [unclassified Oceanobacter]|uniref:6-phosphogluconolactonase n=2 Tax=Gammaproteobacteria TaxID=1236 RepID=UPI0026E172C7|nr:MULTISPECIES: 6-phosphogluconolactonase [unclassified Oceanobacter]MDO6681458.1 6-phosphogluconolactonase [Oceanobacter sp. 5_MG-2023]MDP2609309.1 6-phosphogluconolactonase [Oceanobacter sp. 1_MG-2023]MDP2612594.1 6-phosphogluconolactonase [Oceanobacter sp. 2_MG-2023]
MSDNRFDSASILAKQLADAVSLCLKERVAQKGRACLAVSGGNTPKAFFEELGKRALPWSQILVTLVDERWVDESDPSSNAGLVKAHLLQGPAAAAYFLPLKNAALTPTAGFMDCENSLHEQISRLDVAVLGMGTDGHTASWFPQSAALERCLDEGGSAWSSPVVDAELELPRMTLTWAMLSQCQNIFLHFEGAEKQAVFEAACDPGQQQNIAAMPVRTLLYQSQVPLSIFRTP